MKNSVCYGVIIVVQLLFVLVLCSCGDQGVVVDVDNVELVELNEANSDIRIVPIKCNIPMDGIIRCVGYDDYIFMLGMSRKQIYCIKGDSVVSVLDASGRGHGEYSYINDFTYSTEEKSLYVQGDGKFYLYSVPSMSFIRSFESEITPGGMMVLNPNEILMKCSFYEEKEDVYRGVCVVSSHTGEIIKKCRDLDYINTQWFMQKDFSMCGQSVLYPVNSFNNTLVCYDIESEKEEEVFSFSYNSRWSISKRLVKRANKDLLHFIKEYYERELYCEGCHYPALINSRLTFWSFPRENDKVKCIVTIIKDDKPISRSFKVSGTEMTPSPYYISGNYCVDVITSLDEIEIIDPNNASPLALELNRIAKAQQYDNPVMLFFTVDKWLNEIEGNED